MSPRLLRIYAKITGPIVIVGFGSIGKARVPMIRAAISITTSRASPVIDPKTRAQGHCETHKCALHPAGRDQGQLSRIADPGCSLRAAARVFASNLSSIPALPIFMELCNELGALYIEHRQRALARLLFTILRRALKRAPTTPFASGRWPPRRRAPAGSTTASPAAAANPGMVSFFRQAGAAINVAADLKLNAPKPKTRAEWADLMRQAGVKGIHIARARIPSAPSRRKEPDVFVNTMVGGKVFLSEGVQPVRARLGHP